MKVSTKTEKLYQATISEKQYALNQSFDRVLFKEIPNDEVSRVVIELTPLEAGALNALLGKVGGVGYDSIRKFYSSLFTKTKSYRHELSEELTLEKNPYDTILLIGSHPDFKNYNPNE
mgnify:CR=1 FL=1